MDIWHRVTFNASTKSDFFEAIRDLGIIHKKIESPGGGGILVFVDVSESSPHWATVSELIAKEGAADMVETFFADEEVRNAEWLRLVSTFEQGYPQPKPHWPLKQLSRELLCPECAIYQQTAPMRLAKEPHLGKKSFMSLVWTNEISCTPEVIRELKQIDAKGYEVWDTLIHKTGQPSVRLRQLYLPGIASPGMLIEDDLKRTTCPACGITRYYPHVRGIMRFKREALVPGIDFMLTHEWFGHGLLAWREILISNRVARLVLDKGWQGVRFKVIEVV